MARPLRIELAGSWYHVINEYKLFLDLLNQIHNRYQIEIHAYCLMPNHYHLLIRTPLTNLSRAMRHLNGVYTQRYNQLQKSDGPLFRGRFKSIVVDKEHYFLRLSRYIHLNPVASGLTKKAEKYPWSSYAAYLNPDLSPRWLKQNDILEGFGARMQKQKYRMFVEEGIDKELDTFFKQLKRVPILGSEAFTKTITDKYLTDKKSSTRELPELSQLNKLGLPKYR